VSGFERLDPAIRRLYEQHNDWTVRFTPSADAVRRQIEEGPTTERAWQAGHRAALELIRRELERFPPSERWWSLAMDLTSSAVTVTVNMDGGRRLRVSAEYRLIQEECAIFQLEIVEPQDASRARRQP
jgi:hypothetical protein